MKISTILTQIDLGTIALPKFQRGYVWNREQVRGLMNSLYYKFPIGSLLVWIVQSEEAVTRGDRPINPGVVNLLLDGQQRITSLYQKTGHPLKGRSREKTPLPPKKYIFFRLSSYFRVSTASLYCHLFSHPLFLSHRLAVSPS